MRRCAHEDLLIRISQIAEKILTKEQAYPSIDGSVLGDHVQSLEVTLNSFFRDQDAICGITSWCSSIDVFVMSSDLATNFGFDAIGSNYEITLYPGTILELHSSLEVVVYLDDPRVDTNVATLHLGEFE